MTEFTIKEIGSGWDVRNRNIDQPIVKFIDPEYPDHSIVINNNWVLYDNDGYQELESCNGNCCYYIDLQENQPIGASTNCGGWNNDNDPENR